MSGFLPSLPWSRPTNLGLRKGRLSPCPASPNCVCSDDESRVHAIEAFRLQGSAAGAGGQAVDRSEQWDRVVAVVRGLPRTEVVCCESDYLHAECSSWLLGFVDDLELALRSEAGEIALRSASRLGYSDLGVNRARIDQLRERLREQGIVE